VALTSLSSASAMPLPSLKSPEIGKVEQVQYRRGWNHRHGWHNGHRGYRSYRNGYRRHNGYWFPLAAFGTGALIGGAIAAPPRRYVGPSAHVQWCESRYQTYRAYDNTYVPRVGVRAQCISPYN
jgi:hypothetical protein